MSGAYKRGYQRQHRFILDDLENECRFFLTAKEVHLAVPDLDLVDSKELPERCKLCKFRKGKDNA